MKAKMVETDKHYHVVLQEVVESILKDNHDAMNVEYKVPKLHLTPSLARQLGLQIPMWEDLTTNKEVRRPAQVKVCRDNDYPQVLAAVPAAGTYRTPGLRQETRNLLTAMIALSKREKEILQLAAAGCTNKEIARRCFLTEATVKTHFRNIFDKIDVNNRTAAVVQAKSKGLLDSDGTSALSRRE